MAHPARPMPYGFAEYVRQGYHSLSHLRNRYHSSWQAIYRWLEEADIHQTSQKRMGRDGYEVIMCDLLTGAEIEGFASLVDAATAINGTPQNISYAAKGIYKSAYGFKWRFANGNDSTCEEHGV